MSDFTCMHHNDAMRAACPVCLVAALTAERDQLRADCEKAKKQFEILNETLQHVTSMYDTATTRAERAEAELATERARLDWLEGNAGDIPKYNVEISHARERSKDESKP